MIEGWIERTDIPTEVTFRLDEYERSVIASYLNSLNEFGAQYGADDAPRIIEDALKRGLAYQMSQMRRLTIRHVMPWLG